MIPVDAFLSVGHVLMSQCLFQVKVCHLFTAPKYTFLISWSLCLKPLAETQMSPTSQFRLGSFHRNLLVDGKLYPFSVGPPFMSPQTQEHIKIVNDSVTHTHTHTPIQKLLFFLNSVRGWHSASNHIHGVFLPSSPPPPRSSSSSSAGVSDAWQSTHTGCKNTLLHILTHHSSLSLQRQ